MNDYNPMVFILTIFAIFIFGLVAFDYLIYHELIKNENELHWFLNTLMFEVGVYEKFLKGEYVFKFASTFCLIGSVWVMPSKRKYSKENRTRNTIILLVFSILYWYGFLQVDSYDLIVYPTIILIHIVLIFVVVRSYNKVLKDENILGVTDKGLHHEFSFKFKVDPDKDDE
ncbi:MAG: hypothetical protein AB8F74_19415 [Saprospiraceae bacterium]